MNVEVDAVVLVVNKELVKMRLKIRYYLHGTAHCRALIHYFSNIQNCLSNYLPN